ncbi:hypothetical protein VTI74DRAFT_1335 [Chaetomium olivicolor]
MPGFDTDQQFKFLLCCIKHSAAGKVNFENVAKEMEIVSKAAAAKRYERLLKAHGIFTASTPRKGAAGNAADTDDAEGGEGSSTAPASKKRKRAAPAKQQQDETPIKKEKGVKREDPDEDVEIKDEDYLSD